MAAKAWHTKAKGQKLDFAGNPKTGWLMEEIQLRLVAEIPLFTTGFIYTSLVVVLGFIPSTV